MWGDGGQQQNKQQKNEYSTRWLKKKKQKGKQ